MSEVTSIVKISCFQIIIVGKFVTPFWRVFFDNRLSMVLTKLEIIHEKLIHLNVIGPMKMKMNWISTVGIIVYVIVNIIAPISLRISLIGLIRILELVSLLFLDIYQRFIFYEYILLISYIKWMVYIINEQIPERRSCLRTFRDMYWEVVECLNEINRSIYGFPVIVAFVAGNVAQIMSLFYNSFLFPRDYSDVCFFVFSAMEFLITAANILLLYTIGHFTEKEVNRMSFVLHKRSLLERNPRIKRQIKFFLLRRLHEHYHFKVNGICQINLRNLLSLTNKAIGFLVIQILFRLNKKKSEN